VAQAGKATDFFCPICLEVRLEVGTLHGTEVCCCPACQGFVVDSATFGALIENLRAEYCGPDDRPVPMNPADLELSILCPACFSPMYTHPYYGPGNEIINSCSGCQINWLDAGELTKIIRAPGRRRR
jgi:Zn-finger nucleic acid-binding protein